MKLYKMLAAAAVATVLGTTIAGADTFKFSYTLPAGATDAGVLTGNLLSDGNTFDITGVQSFTVNDVAVLTPFTVSSTDYLYGFSGEKSPTVSVDGSVIDFYANSSNVGVVAFGVGDSFSKQYGNLAGATSSFGGDGYFHSFVPANYSGSLITSGAVPEPATWAMMLVGFGMIGFGLRYRRKSTAVRFACAR